MTTLRLAAALLVFLALPMPEASAAGQGPIPVAEGPSGLPLPRFVSLKAGRVNVRLGPGQDYDVAWVFTRPDLPVEIIQEFDNWRRIRDSDGADGWVFHSLLSGRRTAVIEPWGKGGAPLPLRASPTSDSRIAAYLESGVVAEVSTCTDGWCRIKDRRFDGWIRQHQLWGVYPEEKID